MRRILLFASLVLIAITGALAQGVTTASMSGVVKDSKGEIIPGTNVVATHVPSGTTYGASSRSDGYYNLLGMRVGGPYTVKASFVGYKEEVIENVYLQLGQPFVLNFSLVDEATQLAEVVVSSNLDATLNSDKIGTSSNFNVNQIQTLPSIGRDFRDISRLTPQAGGAAFSFGGRAAIYNNLSIDGATANNVFGLNPLPAGQSNTTPFSMDAIQEITVSLSPYDVRQGNFTGAGISAITRSGNNELSGSAYYFFRNESMAGKEVDGVKLPVPSFNYKNYGVRLGGPMIKNKLFYFVNIEFEKRTDPFYTNPVREDKTQSITGATQGTDDNDPETGLAGLRDFLINTVGYNPGVYKDFDRETNSLRYVARIDYNINQNHKLTIRGNVTNAYQDQPPSGSAGFGPSLPGGRGNSNNVLSFSSSYYRINNNNYSVTAELNSTLGNGKFTNQLVGGFTAFRDFRENAGGLPIPNFPLVDIIGPNGQNMTSFGPDPFTPNNKLDQDVIQLNDNFSIYLKNHTVTVGTNNEYYKFNNVFTQLYNGMYRYNSLADFYADAQGSPVFGPSSYTIQYVASQGGPAGTAAKWSALQMGFYVQDEYTGIKNLKITGGIRVDVPLYLTDLYTNNYINQIDFDGEQLRVGGWPEVKPLWSPRVGFNWDVNGDRSTQIRGGTGVLTGRVPFVWLSNTVNANGLYFGEYNNTAVPLDNTGDGFPYNFSTNPYRPDESTLTDPSTGNPTLINDPNNINYGRPTNVTTTNTLVDDFRFPQVWRSNLAVDKQLPYGVVGTLEFIYTKDINAVFIRNANLKDPVGTLAGDGRPLYGASGSARQIYGNDRRINGDVGQALVLDNTSKGYQWSITAQLQKSFSRNFNVSAAYTYTDAKEVNPAFGTTAGSIFNSQVNVAGANNPGLSYANTLTPHRIVAYGTYRIEYKEHFATTFGLTYEGRSGSPFSYTTNGDINSDGVNADLMYIPKSKDEIVLTTSGATDTRTIDEIWDQLDAYISQDEYLSEHRGEYASRSAAYNPWVNRLNLSLLQDFYTNIKGKRHTFQFSINVENALNMFNSSWGLTKFASRSNLVRFVGYEQPHTAGSATAPLGSVTTGKPVYAFDTNADGTPLSESSIPDQTVGGRWQMQIGLRYIF
jgi:hypothetical protein